MEHAIHIHLCMKALVVLPGSSRQQYVVVTRNLFHAVTGGMTCETRHTTAEVEALKERLPLGIKDLADTAL